MSSLRKILSSWVNQATTQKVNTFIVGTQKGGTTSLHSFLEELSIVKSGSKKEVMFFSHDKNFDKGYGYYQSYFKEKIYAPISSESILIDATPEYLYYPKAAERIYQYNPKAKIIILLREPVSRAFSHWNMFRTFQENNKSEWLLRKHIDLMDEKTTRIITPIIESKTWPAFSELIDIETQNCTEIDLEPSCIRRGIYLPQIQRFITIFGKENVLIIGSKDLKEHKIPTMQKVFDFLNIPSNPSNLLLENKHTREYTAQIKPDDKKRLAEYYKSYNQQLFDYLGYEINW